MSVVKIHTDDLQAIYDILGDVLTKKVGRPSASAAEDLRTRAMVSRDLTAAILGIVPPVNPTPVDVSTVPPHGKPSAGPSEPPPTPQTGAEIAAANMEATVEEVVETVAAEITPDESIPEALLEGDDSP